MVASNPSVWPLVVGALLCVGSNLSHDHAATPDMRAFAATAAMTEPTAPAVSVIAGAHHGVRISKAPDGLFYLSGKVNGAPVRFLIDTGANMVVLTAGDARRVGLAVGQGASPDSIETAGGPSSMSRVTLDHVTVAGRNVASIDAAVMQNGLKVSLMGQNLLSKLGPITMSGDEIALGAER
jgi:aspartyl protease family protein